MHDQQLPPATFDACTQTIRGRGVSDPLGRIEWAMLDCLWAAEGKPVTQEKLMEAWDRYGRPRPRRGTFHVALSRLRGALATSSDYRIERQPGSWPSQYRLPRAGVGQPALSPATAAAPVLKGCRYIGDDGDYCGAPQQTGSSYCPNHHARCYLAPGQVDKKHREFDNLAEAVGGRAAFGRALTRSVLKRIEARAR